MHSSRLSNPPAVLALLVALIAPVACASGEAPAAAPATPTPSACGPAPGPAPDQLPRIFDRGGFNFTSEMLGQKAPPPVDLCVLVDANGQVSDVRVNEGGTPFAAAAMDAVRWWWFLPARAAGKPVCVFVGGQAEASWLRDQGATAFVVASDQSFMRKAAAQALAEIRSLGASAERAHAKTA